MQSISLFSRILIGAALVAGPLSLAQAGSDAEIKYEISFLAKKLLDRSGEDSITIEQPAVEKPFIGICSDVTPKGVKLTCITPGHNAEKYGLRTGDVVTSINDLSMVGMPHSKKNNYHQVVMNLRIGEVLRIEFVRDAKNRSVDVTVGSVSHPAYVLTVSKK